MRTSPLHRLFRRDASDLNPAIRLAKGEEIPEEDYQRLKRAGVARKNRKRPFAPSVVAALLSISESMDRGRGVLRSLKDRLRGAETRPEREMIILSIREELETVKDRLADQNLVPVLEEIRLILDRLDPDDADPAEVMEAAKMIARIIEQVAGTLTPLETQERETAPEFTFENLAASIDQAPYLSRPVVYPDVHDLAAALRGEVPPPVQKRSSQAFEPIADRRQEAEKGLADPDPVLSLFGEDTAVAMERHAALASLGRKGLQDHGRYPSLALRSLGEFDVGDLVAV